MKRSKKPIARRYSGKPSDKFWKTVNSIPRNHGGETAYMLGCLLQDFEERVLGYINSKQPAPQPPKGRQP